jgi:hypothetical protein
LITKPRCASVASDKFSDAAGNTNVDGADVNNSVFLTIDTKAPNAVDLDPAADIQPTSKTLFTRSEISVGVAFDADIMKQLLRPIHCL